MRLHKVADALEVDKTTGAEMTAKITKAQQQGDRASESISKSKTSYKNYVLYNILSVNKKGGKAELIRKFSRTDNDGTNHFARGACKASKTETRSFVEKNARYSVSNTPTNKMKTTREIPNTRVKNTKSEQHQDKGPTDLECTSNSKASSKNYITYNIQSVSKNANKLQSNARKSCVNVSYINHVPDNTNNLKPIKDNKLRIVNNINSTSEGTATEQLTSELKHLLCLKDTDIKKIEEKLKQTARSTLIADNIHRNSSEMALLFFSSMRNLLEELITNALSEDVNTKRTDKVKPVVHKYNTSKRENDKDLSYYEHYLKEVIDIFKQEFGCGTKVLANKSNEEKIETNRKTSNKKENGSTAISVTGSLKRKVASKEDIDQMTEEYDSGQVLSDDDLSNRWYITPYMVELMKEIKHLLQGEAWKTYTKQNNKNYLTLKRNTETTLELTVKPQVNKNSCVKHSLEQRIKMSLPTTDTKVDSARTNNCMLLGSQTMETDMYSKHAANPIKQDSNVVTINDTLSYINEEKNILEEKKATNIRNIGLMLPHNDNTVTCTENISPSSLNGRQLVVCGKNTKSEDLRTTSTEENKMFNWTSQENQKEHTCNTTEQPINCFSNQAARKKTFLSQDRSESKENIKQPIPYGDWYVTNDKISQRKSSRVLHERGVVSHQTMCNVRGNAQKVGIGENLNVDILLDENNHGSSTKNKRKGDEELKNDNTIDDRVVGQPLFPSEGRKSEQISDKPKDLNDRGERKVISTKEDEKQKRCLTRNVMFNNKEQNEIEKENHKRVSGYDFKKLHAFEITLQHVINMFLCLCHKLNNVPLDIKFTPIINLNPPETLRKAILLLPLFIESISEALSSRGYDANQRNMYYELKNILHVFESMCKRSTKRKVLTKHPVFDNNERLINEEMYPSYRTSDVTDILHKEKALRDHRMKHDLPEYAQNITVEDTLVDSHRLSVKTTEKEAEYSNDKLDERQVAYAMNNQSLYSFEENKYVHENDTLIPGVYRVQKSVPNASEGNLNNLSAKFGTEHSVSLGFEDQSERNTTDRNNTNEKSNQTSNSDNDLKDVKYIEQEKRGKGHLKEGSENNLVHPFEITLQTISNMLISVCMKLNNAPTDILFTPILNLNPPETLTKVVFLLPLLTENIYGLSCRTSCKDHTTTTSADENICYEIENILDIFAKAHKESMLTVTKQLTTNISENNCSETIVRKSNCLSNSATNSNNLNTLPKKVDGNKLYVRNESGSSRIAADNTTFSPSDRFVPIASNGSNNFILYKTLQLFIVGKRTQ